MKKSTKNSVFQSISANHPCWSDVRFWLALAENKVWTIPPFDGHPQISLNKGDINKLFKETDFLVSDQLWNNISVWETEVGLGEQLGLRLFQNIKHFPNKRICLLKTLPEPLLKFGFYHSRVFLHTATRMRLKDSGCEPIIALLKETETVHDTYQIEQRHFSSAIFELSGYNWLDIVELEALRSYMHRIALKEDGETNPQKIESEVFTLFHHRFAFLSFIADEARSLKIKFNPKRMLSTMELPDNREAIDEILDKCNGFFVLKSIDIGYMLYGLGSPEEDKKQVDYATGSYQLLQQEFNLLDTVSPDKFLFSYSKFLISLGVDISQLRFGSFPAIAVLEFLRTATGQSKDHHLYPELGISQLTDDQRLFHYCVNDIDAYENHIQSYSPLDDSLITWLLRDSPLVFDASSGEACSPFNYLYYKSDDNTISFLPYYLATVSIWTIISRAFHNDIQNATKDNLELQIIDICQNAGLKTYPTLFKYKAGNGYAQSDIDLIILYEDELWILELKYTRVRGNDNEVNQHFMQQLIKGSRQLDNHLKYLQSNLAEFLEKTSLLPIDTKKLIVKTGILSTSFEWDNYTIGAHQKWNIFHFIEYLRDGDFKSIKDTLTPQTILLGGEKL